MRRLVYVFAAAAALLVATQASAARAPTYIEKVTIMDAFNIPGRSFSSRCVKILVSTVDPRYAMLTSPAKIPSACSKAGQVGDGFVVFHRATRTALRWKNIAEGSDPPCSVPRSVRLDLFKLSFCS